MDSADNRPQAWPEAVRSGSPTENAAAYPRIPTAADTVDRASGVIQAELAEVSRDPDAVALVQLAKSDHATFKKRVIDTVVGRADARSGDLPDHHGCRLGKWYDKVSDPRIAGLPAFRKLVEPHRRVHECGRQALACREADDLDGAIAAARNLNQASAEVLAVLDEIHAALTG